MPLPACEIDPVIPPGEEVAVYVVIVAPPSEAGAVNETFAVVAPVDVAVTEVGAPGADVASASKVNYARVKKLKIETFTVTAYMVSPFANPPLFGQVYSNPHKLKVVGETDIAVIVTPPGNGLKRLFGLPIVLRETEDPILRLEVSST